MGDYLAKWLATVAALVDKSTPVAAALFDASQEVKEVSREGHPEPSYSMSSVGLPAKSR